MTDEELRQLTPEVICRHDQKVVAAVVRGQRPVPISESVTAAVGNRIPEETVILSPGVIMSGDRWTVATLDQPSAGGAACGGLERIRAAARIWHTYGGVVVPTSVRWHLDQDERPDHWRIQKNELLLLGVSDDAIRPEERSIDTITEIAELLCSLADLPPWDLRQGYRSAVVTNRYHVPRTDVMVRLMLYYCRETAAGRNGVYQEMVERMLRRPHQQYISRLLGHEHQVAAAFDDGQIEVVVVAAEEVLGSSDPSFSNWEQGVYQAGGYFAGIVDNEERGIGQLLDGSYGQRR